MKVAQGIRIRAFILVCACDILRCDPASYILWYKFTQLIHTRANMHTHAHTHTHSYHLVPGQNVTVVDVDICATIALRLSGHARSAKAKVRGCI